MPGSRIAILAVDITGMKDGDVAGLGILQEHYGYIAAKKQDDETFVVMSAFRDSEEQEVERVPLSEDVIHLRIDADFRDQVDTAVFSYRVDGNHWTSIGDTLQMRYTLVHFMGARFALFSYATKQAGGTADFDHFRIGS